MSNGYLQGVHTPVEGEMVVDSLEVRGELPEGLSGMFVRNSANPRFAPQGRYHWFDGDGMVHGITLRDGKASYVNRYIRTHAYDLETEAQKPLWKGLMEPMDFSNPNGPIKDTANTDLVWHNGKLLALWWLSGKPYELSVPSLETVGACSFGDTYDGRMAAHAKVCPESGEMMFFDFNVVKAPFYHYGVIDAAGRLAHYTPVDTMGPMVPHDIAITRNYTILLDLPLGWHPDKFAKGKRKIGFKPDLPARFGIIPRHGKNTDIKWFETDACYMYHTIRAYEDGDEIVLTGCRIANPIPAESTPGDDIARLNNIELVPVLYNWRFNMKTGATKEEVLDDVATEFPRVNDATWGRHARFAYHPIIAPRPELTFSGFLKYDLHTQKSERIEYDTHEFGGEVVFAPHVDASNEVTSENTLTEEDRGWVVTVTTAEDTRASELKVFNAQDLASGPCAVVKLPRAIPSGFHAEWVPLAP